MESASRRTFRRIGAFAKIGAVAGIAGVGIAARKAFGEFQEAERATRQTDAVLKSTGNVAGVTAGQIEKLADALSLKSGKDDEAIQSAENLLLTFTAVRNEVGKGNDIFTQATNVIADMSAALGQDFKSSTIQVGKALQDPIKGITALRRVGVNFNAQQTEQVKRMVETGHQMQAQKFILRELRREFEGSAEAQALSSDKLKVAVDNLLEAFGRTFGPVLSKALGGLAAFVTQMQTGEGVGGKFAVVVRGVGNAIRGAFSGISSLASSAVKSIDTLIGRFGDLRTEGKSVPATLGTIFGQAISNIDLAEIADKIGQGIEKGLDFGDDFAASVAEGIQTAFSEIDGEKLLGGLVEVIAQAINALFSPKFWIEHFGAILATVTIFIPLGKIFKVPGFQTLFRLISAPFFRAVGALGKGLVGLFGKAGAEGLDAFVAELARIAPRSVNALNRLLNAIRGVLQKVPGLATGIVARFAKTLVDGFERAGRLAGRGLAQALTTIVSPIVRIVGRIAAAIRPLRGIFRPFETALRTVRKVAEGSFAGIRSAIGFVVDRIRDLIGLLKKVKFPDINPFAEGGIVRSQVALVGEEGPELIKAPTGKMGLVGAAGPEIRSLPTGTRVFSHPETKRKLAPLTQKVVQRLIPAAISQPESLTQRVVQETLGTDQGRQSPGPLLSRGSQGLRTRHFMRVARQMGIPGFARGGVVAASDPDRDDLKIKITPDFKRKQREQRKRQAKRFHIEVAKVWDAAKEFYPNARGEPRVLVRDVSKGASAVTILKGRHRGDVHWPWSEVEDFNSHEGASLATLLHEWTHVHQRRDVLNQVRLREGGAVLFSHRFLNRVAEKLGWKDLGSSPVETPAYKGYAEDVARRSGGWVDHDQFIKPAKGKKPAGERAKERKGTGGPEHFGKPVKASATFTPAVRYLISTMKEKFGLTVSSGLRPLDTGSFHSQGKAADFVGPRMREAAAYVKTSGLYKTLLEGIHNPNLSTDQGRLVPSSTWGAKTWAEHKDHVHLAASRIVETVKDKVAGKAKGGPRRFHKLSVGQYVTIAKQVGFPDPALAAAIFYAESRGNVNAVGDGGDSLGAAQINTPAHPKYDHQKLRDDVFYNFRAAYDISQHGRNFRPWTQYRNAAYKRYLGGKAKPLPKGASKGAGGSTLADVIALRQEEALGTPTLKDDIRWINRGLKYWRGVYRRNKRAGNAVRAKDALANVHTLQGDKRTLRQKDEVAYENLGSLAPAIGTGPNRFRTAGLEVQLEQINLEKARAALTVPRDDDDSLAGLKASLKDDIEAATKAASLWESLNVLVSGGTIYNPYTKKMDKSPVIGTIAQQIEAATSLKAARDDLKSLKDEIGSRETENTNTVDDAKASRTQDVREFLAAIGDLLKQRSNIKPLPSFGEGGVIPGPTGSPQIIQAHAGEAVLTQRQLADLLKNIKGGDSSKEVVLYKIDGPVTIAQPKKQELFGYAHAAEVALRNLV